MKIISWKEESFEQEVRALCNRPDCPPEIEERVTAILKEVKAKGDEAVCSFLEKFDHVTLHPDQLRVTDEEFEIAERSVDQKMKDAIAMALDHIRAYAKRQMPEAWSFSPRAGVVLGEQFTPMERVGCYIPGGTAPLVSTVLHTMGIASVAGVREIVGVTPPRKDGSVHTATLYAMKQAGASEVYRMGGAYAIGALAYGTDHIRKVDKIVGPGNAYVASAKKQVYGKVAIDMVAGPSEIMIVADHTAPVKFIAADMLSQAEHGSGLEQAVLVTDDPALPEKVIAELDRQMRTLPRIETVKRVMQNGVFFIIAENLSQALKIAGDYAPEHLELMVENPRTHIPEIHAAGAIFAGPWTPEPAGDFTAGPSHVLPTGGSARFFHGLSVQDFLRRSSTVEYTSESILREVDAIAEFASMEGLDAHGRSGLIRREGK